MSPTSNAPVSCCRQNLARRCFLTLANNTLLVHEGICIRTVPVKKRLNSFCNSIIMGSQTERRIVQDAESSHPLLPASEADDRDVPNLGLTGRRFSRYIKGHCGRIALVVHLVLIACYAVAAAVLVVQYARSQGHGNVSLQLLYCKSSNANRELCESSMQLMTTASSACSASRRLHATDPLGLERRSI